MHDKTTSTTITHINTEIYQCLEDILETKNTEKLEYTLNSTLKYLKNNKNSQLNVSDLFKLIFIAVSSNLKHMNTCIYNLLDSSIDLVHFKDIFVNIQNKEDNKEELNEDVVVMINLLIQIMECKNSQIFLIDFFDFLVQKDIKKFDNLDNLDNKENEYKENEEKEDSKDNKENLSDRNFWGKSSFILNTLLTIFYSDIYNFKFMDNQIALKIINSLISDLIKKYPILSTSIEIELIYENEHTNLRQLSLSILEKSIIFYFQFYMKSNKEDIENNKQLLFIISENLHLICKRLNDTAYNVRLKCLSNLISLLESSMIPLFFVNSINILVLNKLKDRTISIRRKVVEYLKIAVSKHSFMNDSYIKKATKKYSETYHTIFNNSDNSEKEIDRSHFELDSEKLEGFFISACSFSNNSNNLNLEENLENITDNSAFENFLINKPDKDFFKESLMNFAHFLFSLVEMFDENCFYILNANLKNHYNTNNLNISIGDIENWLEIFVMLSFYGINVTKYLNDCFLLSRDFDKESLVICLKSVGKLIKMTYKEINEDSFKDLVDFLNEINEDFLVELFKYQLIGFEKEFIQKEVENTIENINKREIEIEEIDKIDVYFGKLLFLTKTLKIEISSKNLPFMMKFISSSQNIEILNHRQSLYRNYLSSIQLTQNLLERIYELNCKMTQTDVLLDTLIAKRIYKDNNLLSNIDEIISNILQIICNSENNLKIFSFFGEIALQHSFYLDRIAIELKNNLNKKSDKKLISGNKNFQRKVYEIFKNLKTPKKYKERRQSLADERLSLRESFDNSSFDFSEKKEILISDSEKMEVTENDVDDVIFYLKEHEIISKGCLKEIYTKMVNFIRNQLNLLNSKENKTESKKIDLPVFSVALKSLYKTMNFSAESFSKNFDILSNILTKEFDLPIDFKHNSLIALHDFFINYNSFVEHLNFIFFDFLYTELHEECMILIMNLSKHGILKIRDFWLKIFLSFSCLYYEFLNEKFENNEKAILSEFLTSQTENSISLFLYESICGILFSNFLPFSERIIYESEILTRNYEKFKNQSFKIFLIKKILKFAGLSNLLKERMKISLFLRFLRVENDEKKIEFLDEALEIIFKEFNFSESAVIELQNDENYKKWRKRIEK